MRTTAPERLSHLYKEVCTRLPGMALLITARSQKQPKYSSTQEGQNWNVDYQTAVKRDELAMYELI